MPIIKPTTEQVAWIKTLKKGDPVVVDGNRVRFFLGIDAMHPEGAVYLTIYPGYGPIIGIDQHRLAPLAQPDRATDF